MPIYAGARSAVRTQRGVPAPSVVRARFGDFTLATDPNSIVQSAVNVSNGVKIALQNGAAARTLPHTGACWTRDGVIDQAGVVLGVAGGATWHPSLRRVDGMIMERAKVGTDPTLIRVGMCWFDTSSPATCTEGFGFYLDYASGALRRVGVVRVNGTGTWADAASGTGNAGHSGVLCTAMCGSLTALQAVCAIALDVNGDPVVPQASNKATYQATTVPMTGGTTWRTAIWAGWTATGGTDGVSLTFDPMYWIGQTPGRG